MKVIASRENPRFKALRRRIEAGGVLRGDGLALLEGVHLCQAHLDHGLVPRECVVGEGALAHAEVVALLDRLPPGLAVVFDDALHASLSRLERGGSILFVVEVPRPATPAAIDASAVLLDRVQDPGNVGSILRSAAAAGIPRVFASRDCAGLWSTKVLRAGMGAHFGLSLFEDCDLASLKEASPTTTFVATSSHATRSLFELDLRGAVAWMFGHEGGGLSPRLAERATGARIPQPGPGESLNVAAAAAVCFFEQVRQRGAA